MPSRQRTLGEAACIKKGVHPLSSIGGNSQSTLGGSGRSSLIALSSFKSA